MMKTISMLDLRKRPGQVLDETFYKKYRFLVNRNKKAMAVIIPIDDFKRYFEDEDIEIYSNKRIREFMAEDKLTPKQIKKLKSLKSD